MPNVTTEHTRINKLINIMTDHFGHDLVDAHAMAKCLWPHTPHVMSGVPTEHIDTIRNLAHDMEQVA